MESLLKSIFFIAVTMHSLQGQENPPAPFEQQITDTFSAITITPREKASKIEPAIIAGLAGIVSAKAAEHYAGRFQTRDPASAIATMVPMAIQLGLTIAAAYGASQVLETVKRGLQAPYEHDIARLREENSEFHAALVKHQKTYEEHMDARVNEQLKQAEASLKDLVKDWFTHTETTNAEVIRQLGEQQKDADDFKKGLSPDQQKTLEKLLSYSAKSIKLLEQSAPAAEGIFEKYEKKHRTPVQRFLRLLTNRKK